MRPWLIAILAALVLHAAILLFGGVFFMKPAETATTVESVDLLAPVEQDKAEERPEADKPPPEPMAVEEEAPPEMREPVEATPRIEPTDLVARLDALSLGALETALDPGAAGDAFGGAVSLASGGRIGGTGLPGAAGGPEESPADAIFDIGALDQKPRCLHQAPPVYPRELRQQKVEGTVYVVFVVDVEGRVVQPTIETSPDEAFHAPALEAVRRWKFEPATVRGEKVRARMRVPIRFSLSG
jgi:protein TonB